MEYKGGKMTDKELYYACMNMCTDMFRYIIAKQEIEERRKHGMYDESEFAARMAYEEKRLRSRFEHLKELVDSVGVSDG